MKKFLYDYKASILCTKSRSVNNKLL